MGKFRVGGGTRRPQSKTCEEYLIKDFVIVTGMAGAGKSSALRSLEDMGYFCIDNLPLVFLSSYLSQEKQIKNKDFKLAIHIDSRSENFFRLFDKEILKIKKKYPYLKILYLFAQENVVLRRFSETRRPHPLAKGKNLMRAIQDEKKQYEKIELLSDYVMDTSYLNVHSLKQTLLELFNSKKAVPQLTLSILSFGYRYGIPPACDWVMDVRFLPNPYFEKKLQALTGMDKRVQNYILKRKETTQFIHSVETLIDKLLPQYQKEGKSYLTLGFGCTGGKHRSVTLAEYFKKYFESKKLFVHLDHRDIYRKS